MLKILVEMWWSTHWKIQLLLEKVGKKKKKKLFWHFPTEVMKNIQTHTGDETYNNFQWLDDYDYAALRIFLWMMRLVFMTRFLFSWK